MSKKNIIIGIVIIIVIIVALYFLYKYIKRKHKMYKNVLVIDKLLSNERMEVPNCDIKAPIDGINYTINFYIKLDNFYKNYGYWKHIFHKGTPPPLIGPLNFQYKNLIYNGWCDLVQQLNQQSPGLWLHPNRNTLRLAFTTDNKIMDSNGTNEYTIYPDDIPKGNINVNIPKQIIKYNPCTNIEFCDIDIEMQILTHLLFVVRHKSVDIYVNGKLAKTKVFLGNPIINKGSLYCDYNISYNGYIENFNYIPYHLTSKEIASYNKNSLISRIF
jgi:hypothetical protein